MAFLFGQPTDSFSLRKYQSGSIRPEFCSGLRDKTWGTGVYSRKEDSSHGTTAVCVISPHVPMFGRSAPFI